MRILIGTLSLVFALAIPWGAKAEIKQTEEILCLTSDDSLHYIRLLLAGFGPRALDAVNLSAAVPKAKEAEGQDDKCIEEKIEWDNTHFERVAELPNSKGELLAVVELTGIKRIFLFGAWREIPEWAVGWRYAFFKADAPFLNSGVKPSKCTGNDCI